jgi:integrase
MTRPSLRRSRTAFCPVRLGASYHRQRLRFRACWELRSVAVASSVVLLPGAATLMLAAGIDVKIVSDTLGHSDTRITRGV